MKSLTSPSWHIDAVNRNSQDARLAWDGEVPFIRQRAVPKAPKVEPKEPPGMDPTGELF